MGMKEAVRSVLIENYANFNGRASRSEYWYFVLAYLIVYVIFFALASAVPVLGLLGIAFLGLIIPAIAVGVRRLHDLDKSGWWYLLGLVPLLGLILLYWFCLPGTPGPNQYGEDPLQPTADVFD